MKIEDLKNKYDKLQKQFGAKELDSIYNGGCEDNPDICFVFMNPTGKNIASSKNWLGRKSPWLGTKNIWKLFYKVGLLDEDLFLEIQNKKPKDWDYKFCDYLYETVSNKKIFITNLGKCTQVDARPLSDEVLGKYFNLSNNNSILISEIQKQKNKIICINDSDLSVDFEKCKKELKYVFENMFKEKSHFEK